MAWHQQGTKTYYYRSERVNGRPMRRYVGTGTVAELAAAVDALRRLSRAIEVRELRAEQACQLEAETPLLKLCHGTELLTRVALLAAGYCRHDRGEWRKRREPKPGD